MADDLDALFHLPEGKIQVLHNPVVDPGLPERAAAAVDHPWFQAGQPPVFLGIGRLHPQKDFESLIRAFASVRAARPARLMILGEGEERARLEALVASLGLTDDVLLPGFLDNPYRFLSRAGAFVLSSRWEGLPTVLIEALACGAPVVSVDCPSGPDEILQGGRIGRLVPPGSTDAIAAAMLASLDNPGPREAGLARAQDFAIAPAAARYLDALGV